jgi:predicted peroxiredoxin
LIIDRSSSSVPVEGGRGNIMGRVLAVTTHASDDPTKCTLAFITAIGAIGAGKETAVALVGEGVYLVKEAVARSVHGVGFPPLPELIAKVVNAKIPVYV